LRRAACSAEAAAHIPGARLVDDTLWLDDASSAALLSAARRVQYESVALLFAAREAMCSTGQVTSPAARARHSACSIGST
jgi:hypothetical protein